MNAGTHFAREGRHLDSGSMLQKAYDAGAKRPGVLVTAGREFALGEAPGDAQTAYERAAHDFPNASEAIDAQIGWATAALHLGDVNGAFTRLSEIAAATEGRPRQVPVLLALADLYTRLGLEQEAIAAYSKVATVTGDANALADAATHLIQSGAEDEGIAIAHRVEIAKLSPALAYPFLQAWGGAMLRADVDDALELLLRAHNGYPDERSAAGINTLMKAVLASGRTAQARAILADMQSSTALAGDADTRRWFVSAAADYGDYLFARGDFAAAAEAYGMASAGPAGEGGTEPHTDTEYWNAYQRANALVTLGRVEESLALYDLVAASASSVSRDARARADAARLDLRRNSGPPDSEPDA
jgi:tetratricopeptide (TPR) repeat protein